MATAVAAAAVLSASPAQAEGIILGQDNPNAIDDSYIVVFEDGLSAASDLFGTVDVDVSKTFDSINGMSVTMSQADAQEVAASDSVAYVEQNATVSINATQQDPPSWGLDRVDGTSDGVFTYPDTAGEGVTAYIVDSGIDINHPDFEGRAKEGFDATGEGPGDTNGHGTHVAGTVGGASYGLAKKAELVEVKVLGGDGSGSYEGVIEGVEWVAENAEGPAVANMSLGGPAAQALEDAVTAAVDAGVVFALAAGNESADACDSSPAGAEGALTVGATDDSDARSGFSNFGPCVHVFAPGTDITSTSPGGGESTLSGTSMASPHVAGAATLHLGEYPGDAPEEVNTAIVDNAEDGAVTDPGEGSANKLLSIAYLNGDDSEPGDPGTCAADNTNAQPVPDIDSVESTVTIECDESASADAQVSVDITHSYRGDLSLTLQSPDGEAFALKAQSIGDSAADIDETYTVDVSGAEVSGEWTLVATDHYHGFSGTLNGWSLTVA